MRVNLGIWHNLTKGVIFLLFVAGLLMVFFWYLPLIQQNQRYRKEILALDQKIQEQEKLARQLKGSVLEVQLEIGGQGRRQKHKESERNPAHISINHFTASASEVKNFKGTLGLYNFTKKLLISLTVLLLLLKCSYLWLVTVAGSYCCRGVIIVAVRSSRGCKPLEDGQGPQTLATGDLTY